MRASTGDGDGGLSGSREKKNALPERETDKASSRRDVYIIHFQDDIVKE